MLIIRNKSNKIGLITGFYLIWYGFTRYIIEYYRTDSLMLFNIKIAMVVSVLMIVLGIVIIIKKYRSKEWYYDIFR